MSDRQADPGGERVENPLEGPPEAPDIEAEEVIWSSQSAHYHCTPQGVRILAEGESTQEAIKSHYDAGELEPEPVQVTVRNRHGVPLRLQHQWDGFQLHLDACPTREYTAGPGEALAAVRRYYRDKYGALAWLTLLLLSSVLLSISAGMAYHFWG